MEKIIEMKNIKKLFPGVVALDDITFDLYPGEVHVLIGENGAGKSTLMKILSGVYTPTEGKMIIQGKEYSRLTPKESMEQGISVIFQELSVIDELSVAENLFVGKLPRTKAFGVLPMVDHKYIYKRAQELLDRVGLAVKPTAMVETLSISQKQLVEIAKALAANAKVLIMDEPTSSLNLDEVENLFKIIRSLKESGVGIVYISHKMRELREIGDRITVLKDGRTVATKNIEDVASDEEIVSMMVGRELKNNYFNREMSHVKDKVIFEAKNIVRRDRRVNDVSFTLREGEILGFAGLVGAGKSELCKTLFGAMKKSAGTITMGGRQLKIKNPSDAVRNRMALVPEERRKEGVLVNETVDFNLSAACLSKFCRLSFINRNKTAANAKQFVESLGIKTPSIFQMVRNLSGGNQQKVVVGKWLAADCDIYIFDEPTKGVDVGAKAEIFKLINEIAKQGNCVLYASCENSEILSITDRTYVMFDGRIMAELKTAETCEDEIMHYAVGGTEAFVAS